MCALIQQVAFRIMLWAEERERKSVLRAGERFYKRLSRCMRGNPEAIRESLLHYCLTMENRIPETPRIMIK